MPIRSSLRFAPCFLCVALPLLSGCSSNNGGGDNHNSLTLAQARVGYDTHLTARNQTHDPVADPPPALFRRVDYPDPLGNFPAYISVPSDSGVRHPAIIWLVGGFDNEIGDVAWAPATPDNDQSASAFRKAGIVTMYPSLRGGNNNPGSIEGFYGEVTDVMAAANYLAKQPEVDPSRIYLGGHSTGGTLALLVAESSSQFRAVFSFGPVSDVTNYGPDNLPFDINDEHERELRAPIRWLHAIHSPTYVIEGTGQGNIDELHALADACENPLVHFAECQDADHFSELARTTPVVAKRIVQDTGSTVNISLNSDDFSQTAGQ
jgi:dienelactone hydrolase